MALLFFPFQFNFFKPVNKTIEIDQLDKNGYLAHGEGRARVKERVLTTFNNRAKYIFCLFSLKGSGNKFIAMTPEIYDFFNIYFNP